MLNSDLRSKIDAIAENGWWKGDPTSFYRLAEAMLAKGFVEDEIMGHLEACYSEVAGEFGN